MQQWNAYSSHSIVAIGFGSFPTRTHTHAQRICCVHLCCWALVHHTAANRCLHSGIAFCSHIERSTITTIAPIVLGLSTPGLHYDVPTLMPNTCSIHTFALPNNPTTLLTYNCAGDRFLTIFPDDYNDYDSIHDRPTKVARNNDNEMMIIC